jgi:hypothetical protein
MFKLILGRSIAARRGMGFAGTILAKPENR